MPEEGTHPTPPDTAEGNAVPDRRSKRVRRVRRPSPVEGRDPRLIVAEVLLDAALARQRSGTSESGQ